MTVAQLRQIGQRDGYERAAEALVEYGLKACDALYAELRRLFFVDQRHKGRFTWEHLDVTWRKRDAV